jgi:hypothetical protein
VHLSVYPNTQLARPHWQSLHGLQVGVASDASALGYAPVQLAVCPNTQLARPHWQSLHGLQVGVASDASALGYAPPMRRPRASRPPAKFSRAS